VVHKIINNRFRIFVESLLVTSVIFIVGFSMGFYVESYRLSKVLENYRENEINSLDLRLQNYYFQIIEKSDCDLATEQNFIFADKLYEEGLELERFEEANQITDQLKTEKKRYVLLKTELWLNTILLKEKCESKVNTIVYIYTNDPKNNIKVSEQKVISNVLKEVKEKEGNKVILLPIAGDLKLDIVDLQLRKYNITYLPSIIINEKTVLEGFHSPDEIEKYLKE